MVVLIVENDPNEMQMLAKFVTRQGHLPVSADTVASGLKYFQSESPGLVLLSLNGQPSEVLQFMETVRAQQSPPPVIVTARKGRLEDAVQMMKAGVHDFWVKPISSERLAAAVELLQSKTPSDARVDSGKHPSILTQSPAMVQLKAIAKRVAASSATIFIQGESGTGKEVFARYIHRNSERKNKPFLAVNCAALPENLLESELFGYEKGAFTGAIKAKEGKFELADHGTLLLDEVTEITVQLQAKLLRVLQENEVDRVGGKYPVPIDVRVIATSNAVLEEAMARGEFRRDLFYRLNVIPIKIPPLRERREDIDLLSGHFMEKYSRMHRVDVNQIAPEAGKKLREHTWPGNVRELENVIQRGVLLTRGQVMTPESLIFDSHVSQSSSDIELMSIDEMEKRLIHKALHVVNDNRTRAAEILGISVRTLRNKLNEYRRDHALGSEA